MRTARIHLLASALLVGVLVTGCNTFTGGGENPDVLLAGTDVPLLLSESIAAHAMLSGGLSTASLSNYALHTVPAVDLYGNPFLNLTFSLPEGASSMWDENALQEPGDGAFTVITGARTIHDVLISYSRDLRLLQEMQAAVEALGGVDDLSEVVAATANTLLLRDKAGSLWDVSTQQALGTDQIDWLTSNYSEIVAANSTQEFIDEMQEQWDQVMQESLEGQAAYGYALHDLATPHGGLSLKALAAVSAELTPAAFVDHGRQCFLFVCWHNFTGNITAGNQAVQGGSKQIRSDYLLSTPPIRFNSIACALNNPINDMAFLGCGPSAFIGLVGEKFKNHNITFAGKNLSNTSLPVFKQWLVAPVGVNGRPRIADYMGTCVLGTAYEGFTTLAGFTSGAQNFLNEVGSGLTLKYTAGIGGSTGYNSSTAANMIHLQVGVKENPVVATHWPTSVSAHYAAISHYDIMWGAGVTINVRTMDGGTTWYGLSSHWSGQIGVYYLE